MQSSLETPVLECVFNKAVGLHPINLLKRRLQRKCFPVNFAKFIKTNFLQSNSKKFFASVQSVKIMTLNSFHYVKDSQQVRTLNAIFISNL